MSLPDQPQELPSKPKSASSSGRRALRLRLLHARSGRARDDLELGRREDHGLPRRRDHRPERCRSLSGAAEITDGKPGRDLEAAVVGAGSEEGWLVRKNGSEFWASTVITPLPEGPCRGFVLLFPRHHRSQAG